MMIENEDNKIQKHCKISSFMIPKTRVWNCRNSGISGENGRDRFRDPKILSLAENDAGSV